MGERVGKGQGPIRWGKRGLKEVRWRRQQDTWAIHIEGGRLGQKADVGKGQRDAEGSRGRLSPDEACMRTPWGSPTLPEPALKNEYYKATGRKGRVAVKVYRRRTAQILICSSLQGQRQLFVYIFLLLPSLRAAANCSVLPFHALMQCFLHNQPPIIFPLYCPQ